MLNTLFSLLPDLDLSLIVKVPVLVLLFLYILFSFIIFNKTRVLGRLIFIEASGVTLLLKALTFLHFAASVLLFFVALVIL